MGVFSKDYPSIVEHATDIIAAIGIGSNLGNRAANLVAGFLAVSGFSKTRLLARSPVIETSPVGADEVCQEQVLTKQRVPGADLGGPYLNAAMLVRTSLSAPELLCAMLGVEQSLGRVRDAGNRFAPRTLDLDLLLYGSEQIDQPGLRVPHPRLHERWFVLEPLARIAPTLVVPGINRSVGDLLAQVSLREVASQSP